VRARTAADGDFGEHRERRSASALALTGMEVLRGEQLEVALRGVLAPGFQQGE